ncbi:uncharacterized protein PAC_06487 [Phialocephala subalpina]|uniref:BRCT domain-containing protein n=1 Tax=Phialocephala subalpina TaxID=576137 RepID=A0A1L7WUZ7_9HELO|nr:uncharacterized protein PAC_06487 [Phialocephala subalpina]
MPHTTLRKAEEAAMNGDVPDWDTQNCEDFQRTLLSSPAQPTNTPDQIASASLDAIVTIKTEVEVEQQSDDDAEEHGDNGEDISQLIQDLLSQQPEPEPEETPAEDATPRAAPIQFRRDSRGKLRAYTAAEDATPPSAHIRVRRDSNGKLRPYTVAGDEARPPNFAEQYRVSLEKESQRVQAMEDLTQKSSMSLTQENSESVYEHFDIQQQIPDECPSTATPDDGDAEFHDTIPNPPHDALHSKQFSARTESTAYTYGENDTGHVKIDFEPDAMEEELDDMDDMDDEPSQDPSFAAPQLGVHFSTPTYDPQTPAAPINPFAHKGSVMKPLDMFGATQPSSIARHRASPTSSRPSPDVYNDFSSPPKRQRIGSSPLGRLQKLKDPETSPLQSSVRNILAASSDFPDAAIPRTSGVQSFDVGPRSSRIDEPRPYVSMKESQERRRRMHADSDTDGSDFEAEPAPRNKRREREVRIQREMSSVALPARRPTSSRPTSSNSPGIEVPSTGRRRSVQEEYLAQCEGFDARDTQHTTQQDEVIADSQGLPGHHPNAAPLDREEVQGSFGQVKGAGTIPESEPDLPTSNTPSKSRKPTPQMDLLPEKGPMAHDTMNVDEETQAEAQAENADANESSLPQPSLPLQEMSSNHLRTPMASKSHVLSDSLVPETSPPEERIRPIGEIVAFSFRGETQIDLNEVPGFTQDPNFDERAVTMVSPQRPAPRPRSFRRSNARSGTTTPVEPPTSSDTTTPAIEAPVPQSPRDDQEEKAASEEAPAEAQEKEKTVDKEPLGVDEEQEKTSINEKPSKAQEEPVIHTNNGMAPETTSLDETNDKPIDAPAGEEQPGPPSTRRSGLRTKGELKEPSKSLRRSNDKKTTTPRQASRVAKTKASTASMSSASSTPASTSGPVLPDPGPSERATTQSQGKSDNPFIPAPAPVRRTAKRKSGATVVDEKPVLPTRASKRQSTANLVRDESEDPLALTPISAHKAGRPKNGSVLFEGMAFAVSYVKDDHERDCVTKLIVDNGGRILQEGFDALFNAIPKTAGEDVELSLSESASRLGFTALIADEHSRKAKYMQALALGLPCISGRWVSACVSKLSIIDWTPYLLCAGQSSFLGNAIRSRTISPYPASDAQLAEVFSSREKLLAGRSVLLVTGKGSTQEKRKAYLFLTRALGPTRVGQVVDYQEARKRLAEADAQNQSYDILYVEGNENAADKVVFGPPPPSGGSKKRKRGPTEADADLPAPKKIRIIVDETMVQSLILSQLLEE